MYVCNIPLNCWCYLLMVEVTPVISTNKKTKNQAEVCQAVHSSEWGFCPDVRLTTIRCSCPAYIMKLYILSPTSINSETV